MPPSQGRGFVFFLTKWVFILCKLVLLHPEKRQGKSGERENDCSLKIHPGGKTSLLNPSKGTAMESDSEWDTLPYPYIIIIINNMYK